jgi:hypothetical protein
VKKALHGLKQAPRVWTTTLTDFLRTLGFVPIAPDSGVFTNNGVFIAIYVDDLLITGRDRDRIAQLKRDLSNSFKMSDLGPCTCYLDIRIRRNWASKAIYLDQRGSIDKIIRQFNMENCAPARTQWMKNAWEMLKTSGVSPGIALEIPVSCWITRVPYVGHCHRSTPVP